jgi:hypothetical protein
MSSISLKYSEENLLLMAKPKGWRKEPVRHGLAAKGVRTNLSGVGVHSAMGKAIKLQENKLKKKWPDARTFSGKRYGFHYAYERWVDAVREEQRLRKQGIAARAVQRQTPLLDLFDKRRYGRFAVYRGA